MIPRKPLSGRPLPIARSPLKRSTKPIRKRSRSKAEFARIYGSKARVEWVKSLPCCACQGRENIENHHIESGGMGYKADYTKIVPLCHYGWYEGEDSAGWDIGCHGHLHTRGRDWFEQEYGIDLDVEAAQTQELWASSVLEDTK